MALAASDVRVERLAAAHWEQVWGPGGRVPTGDCGRPRLLRNPRPSLLLFFPHQVPPTLAVLVLSFTCQNIIPSITSSLEGDTAKIRSALVLGLGAPLALFLLFNAVVLGGAGGEALATAGLAGGGGDPLVALRGAGGPVGVLVDAFSFLAIATSFLGFTLGFVDYWADILQVRGRQGAVRCRAGGAGAAGLSRWGHC